MTVRRAHRAAGGDQRAAGGDQRAEPAAAGLVPERAERRPANAADRRAAATPEAPSPAATTYVLDLTEVGRGDLPRAGGKGANLGELVRAGLPVPPGFVLTTDAYDRAVEVNDLGRLLASADQEGGPAAIRAAFERAPVPHDVAGAVRAAYERLGDGPVAVRSSATAEDLPEAAFAGQQETFLNVVGVDAVLDAVRRCWASLWTDRAVAYRARLGIDHRSVKLAVVVQRMVPADAAGVLFTANPVTGARNETVVDANPGLGEAVVGGLVTPDHFVLRRRPWGWRIVERRAGRREVVVRPRPEGGTEVVAADEAGGTAIPRPAIPDSALRELARLGTRIEALFGRPQDVEWALAGGRPFVVQARPITALPEALPRPGRVQRLLAGLVAELLPSRPYPLEMTTWVPTVYGFLTSFFGVLGLRILPLDELFLEEDGVVVRLSGRPPVRPTPAVLLAPLRLVRLARRHDPARWADDPLLAEVEERVRAVAARDRRALSWAELLATVHETLAIPALVWEFRVRYLVRPMLAVARLRLVLTLLRRADRFGPLLFTGVETRTIEMNRALEALAARIRSDPDLGAVFRATGPDAVLRALEERPSGRAFLADLRRFLDVYGHRETGGTMQLSKPTWREAPEVVAGILQGLAAAEPAPAPARPAWEVARDDVLAHPLLRPRRLRAAFLALLAEARYFPKLREDTRFYVTLPVPILRQALLELGRRLVEAGVLDAAEDVFHLRLAELEGIAEPAALSAEGRAELRTILVRRRAKRAELEKVPLVDPRLLRREAPAGEVLLRGVPGSPGLAEGPVRVVRDPTEFGTLRAGEVLVAPYTNPAWTPLFQRAVAVVVDSGGPASHAAIVAREYGIPAVMATIDGTRSLTDGQLVRVDGSAGVVLAVSDPARTRPDA